MGEQTTEQAVANTLLAPAPESSTSVETTTVKEKFFPDYEKLAESFASDPDESVVVPEAPPSSSSPPSSSAEASTPETRTGSPTDGAQNASPAEPPKEATTPAPAPVAAEPISQQPVVTPEPPISSQQQVPPAPVAATPEEQAATLEKVRAKVLPELEKHYALSEEDRAGIADEGLATVLPKHFAKLHFEIQAGVYSAMVEQMPGLVQAAMERERANRELDDKFYGTWPDLKGKDQRVVGQAILAYKQLNPQADVDTVIQQAGALAMLSLGLDPIAARTKGQVTPPPPPAVPVPVPFTPAGTSSAGTPPAVVSRPNGAPDGFEKLAEDWRREMFDTQ